MRRADKTNRSPACGEGRCRAGRVRKRDPDTSLRRREQASSPRIRRTPASAQCRGARGFLDVGHEIPSGVVLERRIGRALAAATLIEVADTVLLRMKEAPLFGLRAAARTAMEKYHRLARGVAAFLEVD